MKLITSGTELKAIVSGVSNERLAYANVYVRGALKGSRYSSLLAALADARGDDWKTPRISDDLLVEVAPGRLANLGHILWALEPSRCKRVSDFEFQVCFDAFSVISTGFGDISDVRLVEVDDAEMPSQSSRVVSRRAA